MPIRARVKASFLHYQRLLGEAEIQQMITLQAMVPKKASSDISVKIELATDGERDWAAGVMAAADPWLTLGVTLEQCRMVCHDLQYIVYIAHHSAQPTGLIILHRHGLAGSPYIKSVAVAANTRSRGIGKALIGFAEDLFRPEAKHIFLCVSSFNRRAQQLYEQLGYRKVGELKDYVVAGESELLLHKLLK